MSDRLMQLLASMQHFPLSVAFLCEDCKSVGNNPDFCPACASSALLGLSGVLEPVGTVARTHQMQEKGKHHERD